MLSTRKGKLWMEHDIQKTVENIVASADQAYMKSVGLLEFEKGLIEEVHFLIPYDDEEMEKAEQYIHQHLNELYLLARSLN